eukprot:NODE_1716_length_1077_cov_259.523483.p1 GENE.NODE_1716_length_1077_cov_259.523483~~NODE_1716_length_1077_cov_259.523483.p1  ORF type:complete len:278 (-),score=64.83 NODE_1716_length_1077_cov_259.523483:118-951(-)
MQEGGGVDVLAGDGRAAPEEDAAATCFDVTISNQHLLFSDGAKRVRRPGGASLPGPAALVRARQLAVKIIELYPVNDLLTFGLAWSDFPIMCGDGFGRMVESWGISCNVGGGPTNVGADGTEVAFNPPLIAGDVLRVECHSERNHALVTVERHGMALFEHAFDLPPLPAGMDYVLGATLPNDCVLEVIAEVLILTVHGSLCGDDGTVVIACSTLGGREVFAGQLDVNSTVAELRSAVHTARQAAREAPASIRLLTPGAALLSEEGDAQTLQDALDLV